MIKVIVNGAKGNMGRTSIIAVNHVDDLTLVAETDAGDDLAKAIKNNAADVVIDFTLPNCVFDNTKTIIESGARPVVGTSGLKDKDLEKLIKLCAKHGSGGIIAPNFALGAVLMMKYAKDAARYYKSAEIIEMHHDKKVDAPSGTAYNTARKMERPDIPIHSVRLPGLFAHQEVLFGGPGELLTIRHDATDRKCMMPGILLACRKAMELDHLVIGLENILT